MSTTYIKLLEVGKKKRDNPIKMEKDLYVPAYIETSHSNVVHNSSKLETTQISFWNRTEEETVVDSYNGPLFMNENEQTSPVRSNVNKPNTVEKKPEQKEICSG